MGLKEKKIKLGLKALTKNGTRITIPYLHENTVKGFLDGSFKKWLGPRKVESSYLDGKVTPTLPPPPKYQSKFPRTSVPPKPVLGPKKIRVQVK